MMEDHYYFYRDSFINDCVGFGPMFPKDHSLFVGWLSGLGKKRGTKDDSTDRPGDR
jgi:hypothetical protein